MHQFEFAWFPGDYVLFYLALHATRFFLVHGTINLDKSYRTPIVKLEMTMLPLLLALCKQRIASVCAK